QGKLQLDQPVEDYLTRWHIPKSTFNREEVTMSRLLNHTSGLSLRGYPGYPNGKKVPSLEESLNGKNSAMEKVQLIYEPGTQSQYSGGGYTLSQLVVEEVTQQDYSDYMKNEILNPLGMEDSSFALHSEDVANLATGYNQWGRAYPITSYRELAAAGLHTNVIDFSKFVTALVDDQVENQPAGRHILSADSLDQMFAPGRYGYGLGFGVISGINSELITHSGANVGYRSAYYMNRMSGDGLIIFTNSDQGLELIQSVIVQIHKWETENQSDYRFGFNLITLSE
ncbi:MAG: beta-lactamase family protein, partial [Cohnella sp.]|nr:beta-lactamase family protein [Cohnella sp.]